MVTSGTLVATSRLFDLENATKSIDKGITWQSRVMATLPAHVIEDIKKKSGKYGEPKLLQVNWRESTNRPLMDIVGNIETPYLLMNPAFTPSMVETYYGFFRDTGKGMRVVANHAGSKTVEREMLVNDGFLAREIDWGLVNAMSGTFSLDKATRLYTLSLGHEMVSNYLKKNPDNLDKYDDDIGNRMARTLLYDEPFTGDPDDPDEVHDHDLELVDIERIEKSMINEYRPRFTNASIEYLAKSQFVSTRAAVACAGIDEKVMMDLAKDKSVIVRKKVVSCTRSCKVLDVMIDDERKAYSPARDAARRRASELSCK